MKALSGVSVAGARSKKRDRYTEFSEILVARKKDKVTFAGGCLLGYLRLRGAFGRTRVALREGRNSS